MTAGIYLRFSQDRTGEELGIERHRPDCHSLAAQRGWDVLEFVDNDTSATNGKHRPGYQALMAAVDAGTIDKIIVWHTSRLWRSRRERADGIERLKRAKASVVPFKGPELDMTTAYGRGMAGLVGEFDSMEVEIKSERQVREAQQRASRGVPNGGRRAFGYAINGLDVVPEEAMLVVDIFEQIRDGAKLSAVCTSLNTKGVRTTMGGLWKHNALRIMLQNPRYIGKRAYKGEVVGDAAWPAIVGQELFDAVQAVLADPGRRTNHVGSERRWLGSGLYLCGKPGCDGKMRTTYKDTGNRVYRCAVCRMSRGAGEVDALVHAVMRERLGRHDVADVLVDQIDTPERRDEVAELRRRRRSLSTLLVDGVLSEAEVRTEAARLDGLISVATVTGKDTSAIRKMIQSADPVASWDDAAPLEQAIALDALLVVVLLPVGTGRRVFDPRSVVFDWR